MENIGLQDSLLSRFDLLFILLDTVDVDTDRKISDHVVRTHRYRNPREADGEVTVVNTAADELATANRENVAEKEREAPVWDKYDSMLSTSAKKEDKLLSKEFVKKYIMIAKQLKPTLTEKACEIIGEEYSRIRSQDWENTQDMARTQPVTARALETLIRLSTAHAKARLSNTVEAKDAEVAIELVQFAYFKKVLEKEKKRSRGEDDESEEEEEEEMAVAEEKGKDHAVAEPAAKKAKAAAGVEAETMEKFKKSLFNLFEKDRAQQLPLDAVKKAMAEENGLSDEQVMAAIEVMSEQNKIMLSAEILYLI
jgi:DNA replication licensing factor MCM3